MIKMLEERLSAAKVELGKVNAALVRHSGKLPSDVEEQFRKVTSFADDVEHWTGMVQARSAARLLLENLESHADGDGLVPFGAARVKYQHVRFIGVQAYLATSWGIADRVIGMVGRVMCTPDAGFDNLRPAQLVSHFVQKDRKKTTAGALFDSVRLTFGWPIGVSYALRNHFCHDGAQISGSDFFAGPTAASRFTISAEGWTRVEERARSYGVDSTHHRAGANWPTTPHDDLRLLLDVCEREMDDALGVLINTACGSLLLHVGCMLGEH